MGKSAPGSALRGFPHAIRYRLLTSQGNKGGAHDHHCATLQISRYHDGRLKSLGKVQRASLGTFKRAPTLHGEVRRCRHHQGHRRYSRHQVSLWQLPGAACRIRTPRRFILRRGVFPIVVLDCVASLFFCGIRVKMKRCFKIHNMCRWICLRAT